MAVQHQNPNSRGLAEDRGYHHSGFVGDQCAEDAFTAMIDHILAEPATA
jgi:hypothetical protein